MKKLVYCLIFLLVFQPWTGSYRSAAADRDGAASLTVQAIAAGNYFMLVLMSDGTVMSWGRNTANQLGVGSTGNRIYASKVQEGSGEALSDVAAVSAGAQHALALKEDGTVYSWGHNGSGEIGRSGSGSRAMQIDGFGGKKITEISAGESHSLALDEDGGVWAWGSNIMGQIGNGTTTNATRPVAVMASASQELAGIKTVAGGQFHSLAVTESGEVLAWGMNTNGQLGDGTQTRRTYPVNVRDGSGDGDLTDVDQLSSKGYNSLALKSDGTLWAWGDNSGGQLGKGNYAMSTRAFPVIGADGLPFGDVKEIASGFMHAAAVRNDGTLWTWGSNQSGTTRQYQLGRSWDQPTVPTPGQVLTNEEGAPVAGVVSVATGNAHTSVLLEDGSVWSVGSNFSNVLGGNRTETEIQHLAQLTMSSRTQSNWASDAARSAIAGETVTLAFQLADNAGAPLNIGTDKVSLHADFGAIGPVAYAGEGRFTATYRSEQVGRSEVAAIVNGIEAIAKLNVQVSAGEPSVSRSELKAVPTALHADGTSVSTLRLELLDEWDNAMTSSVPNVSLHATRGTLWTLTELSYGLYEAELVSTEAGPSSISVMLGDEPFGLTANVYFLSGEPDATGSTLTADTSILPANGEASATLELKLYDVNGNALTQSGGEISLVTDLGQIGTVTEFAYGIYTASIASLEPGKATITALRGNEQMGQAVEIDFVPYISRIDFAESAYELRAGTSMNTYATATYWNNETADVTEQATFTVSNPSIATVSDNGVVTGIRAGQATITASLGGLEATVPVTVTRAASGGNDQGGTPTPGPNPTPTPPPTTSPVDSEPEKEPEEQQGSDPDTGDKMTFSDVTGHWAEWAINYAIEEGIAAGYPDGTFKPDGAVTRAEMAVLLTRALGLDTSQAAGATRDSDEQWPSWASGSIAKLMERGIVNGYSNGRFEPALNMNRSEIAAIMVRALGLPTEAASATPYDDDAAIPAWAKPYVSSATKAGLMQGRSNNQFVPNGTVTRAEAVTLIVRLRAAEQL